MALFDGMVGKTLWGDDTVLRTDFTRSSHPGRGLGAECCSEGIANAKAIRQERPCQGQQAKKKQKKKNQAMGMWMELREEREWRRR